MVITPKIAKGSGICFFRNKRNAYNPAAIIPRMRDIALEKGRISRTKTIAQAVKIRKDIALEKGRISRTKTIAQAVKIRKDWYNNFMLVRENYNYYT